MASAFNKRKPNVRKTGIEREVEATEPDENERYLKFI